MAEVHAVAGSYAHVLFGYDFIVPSEGKAKVVPRYIYESHVRGITSLAVTGSTLVSGSADESIKVYDLAKQKEVGSLFEQQGTLTCLEFFQGDGAGKAARHMLSGSEDGSIVVWDAKAWDAMKVLRGHKAAVVDLSIHPSGRLALSVGRDKTLYTWNLLKGRSAYVTALKKIPSLVQWFNGGIGYAVVADKQIDMHATASGAVYTTITAPSQIHAISFTSDSKRVVVGCNDALVRLFDIESGEVVHTIDAHDNRVRNLAIVPSNDGSGRDCLVTSSTDGYIRVWWVGEDGEEQPRDAMVGEVKTEDRLTCMAVLHAGTSTPAAAAVAAKPAPTKSKAQKNSEKKRRQRARKQAAAAAAADAGSNSGEDDDDDDAVDDGGAASAARASEEDRDAEDSSSDDDGNTDNAGDSEGDDDDDEENDEDLAATAAPPGSRGKDGARRYAPEEDQDGNDNDRDEEEEEEEEEVVQEQLAPKAEEKKVRAPPTAEEAEARKAWKAARQKKKNQAKKERLIAEKRAAKASGDARPGKRQKTSSRGDRGQKKAEENGFETVPLEGERGAGKGKGKKKHK